MTGENVKNGVQNNPSNDVLITLEEWKAAHELVERCVNAVLTEMDLHTKAKLVDTSITVMPDGSWGWELEKDDETYKIATNEPSKFRYSGGLTKWISIKLRYCPSGVDFSFGRGIQDYETVTDEELQRRIRNWFNRVIPRLEKEIADA